jgi:MFS superfamily sulfate permease-like transporter
MGKQSGVGDKTADHEGRIMATTTVQTARPATGLSRFLPILTWLPTYQRAWLRRDFIAGLTILALLIPEGMAYAELAGLPPQTAFYAAPIGLLLYAVFGTSRQLMVAVSAAIATMSAATVAPLAAAGSPEYAAFSAALALLAGIISVAAGLFKLGRIASFFSESVLVGFITGLAMTVAIKQVPKLFGFEAGQGNFWERLYDIIIHLPETHALTLIVGVSSIALLLFLEHRFHKIPAALVVMILSILASVAVGLEARGVHVVGEIRRPGAAEDSRRHPAGHGCCCPPRSASRSSTLRKPMVRRVVSPENTNTRSTRIKN